MSSMFVRLTCVDGLEKNVSYGQGLLSTQSGQGRTSDLLALVPTCYSTVPTRTALTSDTGPVVPLETQMENAMVCWEDPGALRDGRGVGLVFPLVP